MGVRKLSVSLDEEAAAAAREAADAAGMTLSAWLSRAATNAAALEAGRRAMDEYEAEHGPFTEAEKTWADEVLDRHGIGRQ